MKNFHLIALLWHFTLVFGGCYLQLMADSVVISNEYVHLSFNRTHPQIDVLSGDFFGSAPSKSINVLQEGSDPLKLHRSGIVLEVDTLQNSQAKTSSSSAGAGPNLQVTVVTNTTALVVVKISGIVDQAINTIVTSTWTLSLAAASRSLSLSVTTQAVASTNNVASIRVSSYLAGWSIYGFFERGIVQMMNQNQGNYFASQDQVVRIYTLGGNNSADISLPSPPAEVVLMNTGNSNSLYKSAVQFVQVGSYPAQDAWDGSGWGQAKPVQITSGQSWSFSMMIAPNNRDFPAAQLSASLNVPSAHTQSIYTGVYASPAGAIVSYLLQGHIAPTIATPGHAYAPLYNFYDPDTFFTISALVYSGDPYLQNECRKLLELNGNFMLPTGQLPHHFITNQPTYVAISGATQTGPNLFWASAALLYAKNSANYTWLSAWLPKIENAVDFVLKFYNPKMQMVSAPGPLWIDVFVRDNFTSDSNAYLVHVLEEMYEVEIFAGSKQKAFQYQQLAINITNGINTHLWSSDHYITQINPNGSIRDFVDYDSNLLAVAFGVSSPQQSSAILRRVDQGKCTHARATYVSEKLYDSRNCYNGNTGDSEVTMGRIGWADALARNRTGDITTYENLILNPVMYDLIEFTWLYERYDCQARFAHNNYYIEYPEFVVMLLREITYGINLGFNRVQIAPFSSSKKPWTYAYGNVVVSYSQQEVTIEVPGNGSPRQLIINGLISGATYNIKSGSQRMSAAANSDGILVVAGVAFADKQTIMITQLKL